MLYLKMPMHVLTMSWMAGGQHKSHTKITFFFEKNVVDCTTFAGQPTELAGPIVRALFILDYHIWHTYPHYVYHK